MRRANRLLGVLLLGASLGLAAASVVGLGTLIGVGLMATLGYGVS